VLQQEPNESVQQGAASSFSDNAYSWQELHAKVQQRQKELQWEMPDLENVCTHHWHTCTRKYSELVIIQSCCRGLPMLAPSREALVTATSPHLNCTGMLWSKVLAVRSVCYEAHARTHDADIGCRDSAAWCPYCQKVWLQLEEKQIPYVIEKINMRCYGDKPAAYTAKVLQSAGSTLQLALQRLLACLISKLFSRRHTSRTLALFDTRLHCCSSCDICDTC